MSTILQNDVDHFIHLITTWQPLQLSKYPRTKQLFTREMLPALNVNSRWAKKIALAYEIQVENIIGEYDNKQYVPELVPIIINSMKLFPS
ncbi:Uncharacterized protein FWK35_00033127 [Aphis craccivora]|uniref:Uncharacterized protein n=1 Tax=Aphis craccivora TaxID=307492 RepID=A0A6G0VSJ1_APHCR|nr:Uncharacterized protein FWK35_00033127 [Aphis craccivora]